MAKKEKKAKLSPFNAMDEEKQKLEELKVKMDEENSSPEATEDAAAIKNALETAIQAVNEHGTVAEAAGHTEASYQAVVDEAKVQLGAVATESHGTEDHHRYKCLDDFRDANAYEKTRANKNSGYCVNTTEEDMTYSVTGSEIKYGVTGGIEHHVKNINELAKKIRENDKKTADAQDPVLNNCKVHFPVINKLRYVDKQCRMHVHDYHCVHVDISGEECNTKMSPCADESLGHTCTSTTAAEKGITNMLCGVSCLGLLRTVMTLQNTCDDERYNPVEEPEEASTTEGAATAETPDTSTEEASTGTTDTSETTT